MSRLCLIVFFLLSINSLTAGTLADAAKNLREGDYEAVAAYFKDNPPKASDAFLLQCRYLDEVGEYGQIQTQLETARKALPDADLTKLETLSASALISLGKYDAAKELLDGLIKRDRMNLIARGVALRWAEIAGDQRTIKRHTRYLFRVYRQGKVSDYRDLVEVAKGAGQEDPQGALKVFMEAFKKAPDRVEAYLGAVELCLSKYDWGRAQSFIGKAYQLNPRSPQVLTKMAEMAISQGQYTPALQYLITALEVNPKLSEARQLKAMILCVENDYADAEAELKEALTVNPVDPDTWAVLASVADAQGKDDERDKAIAKVLEINPKNSDVYCILSEQAEKRYHFQEANSWAGKAVDTNPESWWANFQRGMSLLRLGEEKEGYSYLDKAFKANRFNIWAYNMLTAVDQDFRGKAYDYRETEHFLVKLPKRDSDVMWPYLEPLLDAAYERFAKKYKIRPTGPKETGGKVLVLVLPNHAFFSARTVGLPGLSASGACFGQVVTMPSPREGLVTGFQYDWHSVFEHEFMHVITVQKSKYRTSRWFTEGLSSWEEPDDHPDWRQMFIWAQKNNKLLPVEVLESGFHRPTYPRQVPVSYYQSALICQYINDTYGFEAIVKMLELYAEEKQTPEIIETISGMSVAEFNKKLSEYYAEHVKAYEPKEDKKNSFGEECDKLAEEISKEKKMSRDPIWYRMAQHFRKNGETDKALRLLNGIISNASPHVKAYILVGDIRLDKKEWEKALKAYRRSFEIDPFQASAHLGAAKALKELGQKAEAATECERALLLEPKNKDALELRDALR